MARPKASSGYRKDISLTFDPERLNRFRAFVEAKKGNNLSGWLESIAIEDSEFREWEHSQKMREGENPTAKAIG